MIKKTSLFLFILFFAFTIDAQFGLNNPLKHKNDVSKSLVEDLNGDSINDVLVSFGEWNSYRRSGTETSFLIYNGLDTDFDLPITAIKQNLSVSNYTFLMSITMVKRMLLGSERKSYAAKEIPKNFTFDNHIVNAELISSSYSLDVADLDGDLDEDLLLGPHFYKNYNGVFNYNSFIIFSETFDGYTSIAIGDLNSDYKIDDFTDKAFNGTSSYYIQIFRNNGLGVFALQSTISYGAHRIELELKVCDTKNLA